MNGPAIKEWREQHHIQQDELARKLGVSAKALSNFENGISRSMHPRHMRKLAIILEEEAAPYGTAAAFCHQLRAELTLLGEWMISKDLSGQQKAEKFRSTITYFHDHLDTYLAALRKIDRDHP